MVSNHLIAQNSLGRLEDIDVVSETPRRRVREHRPPVGAPWEAEPKVQRSPTPARHPPEGLRRFASAWWHPGAQRRANVVEDLHAEARLALIVSLVAFCCPPVLPAGLFLGWRVRNHARRSVPDLVEWVSLPYYIASASLWFGAALGIIAIVVMAVCAHC